jgi:hypothetical protein
MKKILFISVLALTLIAGWILKDLKVVYNIKDTYYVITYFTIAKAVVLIMIFGVLLKIRLYRNFKKKPSLRL